ncbi:CaiB/BaiF CoA transferase family protein [Kiloniella sp.]|uniref:CaiB/BaiF CoA transferase family protein n=1 Tax=Kiloniella sp. TaxID=1938587 RepID=UPI003B01A850
MPLSDLKVVDLSTIIAGPFASALLGDFGAEVIKVELPHVGDSLRHLPPHKDGAPLWWKVTNRNKKGITLDIRTPEGRELFQELMVWADVLVENFRPGTLAKYGFSSEVLEEINAELIVLRVSGFGQTGPMSGEPGFARVAEAFSGFTYLCGPTDGPPMHLGYPISDAVAGVFGAFGILIGCLQRAKGAREGIEEVDVSLVESMFRLLEFSVIEQDQLGESRERFGNGSKYAGPSNIYRSQDDHWVSLSASTQRVFERCAHAIGRSDLIDNPNFASNPDRVKNAPELDEIISEWFSLHTLQDALCILQEGDVPVSKVNPIQDVINSPQMKAREAVVRVPDAELGEVAMQGVYPRMKLEPGHVRSTGPTMGQHNDDVFRGLLGMTQERLEELKEKGVI